MAHGRDTSRRHTGSGLHATRQDTMPHGATRRKTGASLGGEGTSNLYEKGARDHGAGLV
jgi:hypothetical protein